MSKAISYRVEKLANEIIQYSDGSMFVYSEPEGIENLTKKELYNLWEIVDQEITTCDSCGWWSNRQDMEIGRDGGEYCWQCIREEEDNEEI